MIRQPASITLVNIRIAIDQGELHTKVMQGIFFATRNKNTLRIFGVFLSPSCGGFWGGH